MWYISNLFNRLRHFWKYLINCKILIKIKNNVYDTYFSHNKTSFAMINTQFCNE